MNTEPEYIMELKHQADNHYERYTPGWCTVYAASLHAYRKAVTDIYPLVLSRDLTESEDLTEIEDFIRERGVYPWMNDTDDSGTHSKDSTTQDASEEGQDRHEPTSRLENALRKTIDQQYKQAKVATTCGDRERETTTREDPDFWYRKGKMHTMMGKMLTDLLENLEMDDTKA